MEVGFLIPFSGTIFGWGGGQGGDRFQMGGTCPPPILTMGTPLVPRGCSMSSHGLLGPPSIFTLVKGDAGGGG